MPSIRNSTGSDGFLKSPLTWIREFNIDRNSLSLGTPSPVTLEIVKIGHNLSEDRLDANIDTSSSGFTTTGSL
jgi:hypothetical protein